MSASPDIKAVIVLSAPCASIKSTSIPSSSKNPCVMAAYCGA